MSPMIVAVAKSIYKSWYARYFLFLLILIAGLAFTERYFNKGSNVPSLVESGTIGWLFARWQLASRRASSLEGQINQLRTDLNAQANQMGWKHGKMDGQIRELYQGVKIISTHVGIEDPCGGPRA